MNNTMCSIIVPVFNVQQYLSRCVESLINQTYKDIEIILVDDGSTDGSGEICDKYAEKDTRIKVMHQKNKGLSGARNSGTNIANGSYVAYVDSDDWIDLNTIELLMDKAIETQYDIIAHAVYKNREGTDTIVLPSNINELDLDVNKYRKYLYVSCLLNQSGYGYLYPNELRCGPEMSYPVLKIFKKKFLYENELFFPEGLRFCEDKVFELNVVSHVKSLFYINKPLYHYYIRRGSLSNRKAFDKQNDYLETFRYLKETMNTLNIYDELIQFFYLNVIQSCWNVIEKYGMECNGVADIVKMSHTFSNFMNEDICCEAIFGLQFKLVKGVKHRLLTTLIKKKWYKLAIFICNIYYRLNPQKNVLKG